MRAFAGKGCGADVVSGAELLLALACGISAEGIVFSGVAKTDEELDIALGTGPRGIRAVQVESIEEIARIDARARALGRTARIAMRLNPGLELDTFWRRTLTWRPGTTRPSSASPPKISLPRSRR